MKILFVIYMVETTEPMGVMLLSALAKREGHDTFLHVLKNGPIEDKLAEVKPDIVAFSCKTGDYKYYAEANEIVKKYNQNIFTIMGGPHPTFQPQILFENNVDAIGVGECDDAWPDLLRILNEIIVYKSVIKKYVLDDIPNIITKNNFDRSVVVMDGKVKYNNIRPRRGYLDDLPFLDYDLYYQNTDFTKFSPRRTFLTSRGCPFCCTYCFNRRFNEIYSGKGGGCHNRYSVDRVIKELEYLKEKYPDTQFIKFYDDVFALRADNWLEEFAEKYPKKIGLPFLCLTRADCVASDPRILHLLKGAGIHSLSMSIESGNDYVRKNVLERKMTKISMLDAFRLAFDLNIYTFANSIYAIPVKREIEEKYNLPSAIDRDIESLDLNLSCKITFSEFPILFPYPGTKLGEYCVEQGFFDGNFKKLHASYQTESPLDCFSKKEKMMQQNLALLSTICVLFGGSRNDFIRKIVSPFFRNIVVNILIKLPLTKFYFIFYNLIKNYLYKYKIYASKYSTINFIKSSAKLFFVDLYKQFGERK